MIFNDRYWSKPISDAASTGTPATSGSNADEHRQSNNAKRVWKTLTTASGSKL